MWTKAISIGLVAILSGCMRPPSPRTAPLEDDRSIVFPNFYEHSAVHVGAGSAPYEMDGVVLKAIMIAANHFRPPGTGEEPCWARQEAQRYRVIRQGDVIFVDISEDLDFCGLEYISLDSGATYAISVDGRILRHITGAHPDRIVSPAPLDAGSQGTLNELGSPATMDTPQSMPLHPLRSGLHDGGAGPGPLTPQPPPTPPSTPDGGTPRAP